MNNFKVIGLDDDPTGTQTVSNVPVLTIWDESSIINEMLEPGGLFFSWGSLLPGVPVWITGSESKFPGLHFVIFPGNVGEKNTLLLAFLKLYHQPVPAE